MMILTISPEVAHHSERLNSLSFGVDVCEGKPFGKKKKDSTKCWRSRSHSQERGEKCCQTEKSFLQFITSH
jgi:hypothetical protein